MWTHKKFDIGYSNNRVCTYMCILCNVHTYIVRMYICIHVCTYVRSTVPLRGNVALACNFLSSGEFDSIVSQVHLLFYNTNSEKLQWIYARRPCHSTS